MAGAPDQPASSSSLVRGFAVGMLTLLITLASALIILFPFAYYFALAAAPVLAITCGAVTAYRIGAGSKSGRKDGGRAVVLLLIAVVAIAGVIALVLAA